MKNIILVNSSSRPSKALIELFKELNNDSLSFFVFSDNKNFLRQFGLKLDKSRQIYLGKKVKTIWGVVMFFLIFPFIWLKQFVTIFLYKRKYNIDVLVCVEDREKLIFTMIAKLLKIKVIWIKKPIISNISEKGFIFFLLRLISKNVKIITFLEANKQKLLKSGFKSENVVNVSIGIKDNFSQHQDSIFSGIAKLKNSSVYHNRFSIGVFLDKKKIHDSEIIFKAMRICLDRFHDIRLVVIGDEVVRKKAIWMAKQSNISEVSCFIGDASGIKKIQKSIDVFLALDTGLKLIDLNRILTAMMFKIPVISFKGEIMSELIMNRKTGILIDKNSPEKLADTIVQLQKDNVFRSTLGNSAHAYAYKNFSFDNQIKKFKRACR